MLLGFPDLQAAFPKGSRSPTATGRKLSLYHSNLSRALMIDPSEIPTCALKVVTQALLEHFHGQEAHPRVFDVAFSVVVVVHFFLILW